MNTTQARLFVTWSRVTVIAAVATCWPATGVPAHSQWANGLGMQGNAPVYLALGDSYVFGSNTTGLEPRNDNFWIGYPYYLQQLIDRPLVNAACPGETSLSFLTGDHTGSPMCQQVRDAGFLHVEYTGPQMEFAEDYLAAHDRVALVTLQIGGGDFNRFVNQCKLNPACILAGLPGFEAALAANVDIILTRIRGAGYEGQILIGQYPSTNYASTLAQVQAHVNQAMAPIVTAHDAAMAPVFERFQTATEPYGGDSCAAGLLITNPDGSCNVHPTDAGHQLIASIMAEMVALSTSATR
jgi:lysophospholipase L1-like esterase